jgi:Uncharacterised nucleotidyltransferase
MNLAGDRDPVRQPEQSLLIACARWQLAAKHHLRIKETLARMDVPSLLTAADEHGIGYFVVRHLLQVGRETPTLLPASVLEDLRQNLRQRTAHAMPLVSHQLRLAAEFDRAGIPVVWLKGLALSEQLYGRFEARQCIDLDVLTAANKQARAADCLRHLGYVPFESPIPGFGLHVGLYHSVWQAPDKNWPLCVELHTRLAGPASCQPPARDILCRSRLTVLEGRPLRVPSREDELLMLALHAHQHDFGLLRCIMDVAEYAQRFHNQLDWEQLSALARRYRCRGRLAGALWLAHSLLGLEDASARVPAMDARQHWALCGLDPSALLTTGDPMQMRRARLGLLMDRWGDVLRLLGPNVLPPSQYVQALFPQAWARLPGMAHLLYLVRYAARVARARADRGGAG